MNHSRVTSEKCRWINTSHLTVTHAHHTCEGVVAVMQLVGLQVAGFFWSVITSWWRLRSCLCVQPVLTNSTPCDLISYYDALCFALVLLLHMCSTVIDLKHSKMEPAGKGSLFSNVGQPEKCFPGDFFAAVPLMATGKLEYWCLNNTFIQSSGSSSGGHDSQHWVQVHRKSPSPLYSHLWNTCV